MAGARRFFDALEDGAGMMIKAVAGGGGRGMRAVESAEELASAYKRCRSEAKAAFGDDAVFVEQLLRRARHVEIQVVGDGSGAVSHLGERECSVQRRHQKLIEVAPSPSLDDGLRRSIAAAAVEMAEAVDYRSLGTFEFLVDTKQPRRFFFMEANPRLQVEHTVTEQVTGIDLVRAQLRLAGGEDLREVGLTQASVPAPRGYAIQARINTERMEPDGEVRPTGGLLTGFAPPMEPGIRVDTHGFAGYTTSPHYDSLLAKVIGHSADGNFASAASRTSRALHEFEITGSETNREFLGRVLDHPDFVAGNVYTRWVDDNIGELAAVTDIGTARERMQAGAALESKDPLAALNFFRDGEGARDDAARKAASRRSGPPKH